MSPPFLTIAIDFGRTNSHLYFIMIMNSQYKLKIMKNIANHRNQLRHLHATELNGQNAIEINVSRTNFAALQKIFEYSPEKCSENANQVEKRKLHIKNMVSNCCKMKVREELKKLGLHFIFIDLGEVEIMENISGEQRKQLEIA